MRVKGAVAWWYCTLFLLIWCTLDYKDRDVDREDSRGGGGVWAASIHRRSEDPHTQFEHTGGKEVRT